MLLHLESWLNVQKILNKILTLLNDIYYDCIDEMTFLPKVVEACIPFGLVYLTNALLR